MPKTTGYCRLPTRPPQFFTMLLGQVTPLILTLNEEPNIDRVLQHLTWAHRIVVVDSHSTDRTLDILQTYPQVEVFQRQFDNHTAQWNYGLNQVESVWVLSLDADYILTDEFIAEMDALPPSDTVGYYARFRYCVFGKPLHGTLYPPRQVLFRKDKAVYVDDGHTQLLQVNGASAPLSCHIYHDDRKPVDRWFRQEIKYAALETKKLLATPYADLSFVEKIRRKKVLAPLLVLIYCLIVKGGVLDGWRGWYYTCQRTLAELLLSINLTYQDLWAKQDLSPGVHHSD